MLKLHRMTLDLLIRPAQVVGIVILKSKTKYPLMFFFLFFFYIFMVWFHIFKTDYLILSTGNHGQSTEMFGMDVAKVQKPSNFSACQRHRHIRKDFTTRGLWSLPPNRLKNLRPRPICINPKLKKPKQALLLMEKLETLSLFSVMR